MSNATLPSTPAHIIKRNGTTVPFRPEKIVRAIEKAMRASGEHNAGLPEAITQAVVEILIETTCHPFSRRRARLD